MVTAINSRLLVFYAQMHRQTNVLWDQLHGVLPHMGTAGKNKWTEIELLEGE